MKEIYEAVESRIKSPFIGYFLISLGYLNWKPIYYLFASKLTALERVAYFEVNTSWLTLLVYPLIFTLAYPWLSLIISLLSTKPLDLKNNIQAQSEHSLLIKRQELEEIRAQMMSTAEQEIIDRAKREEELENIDNENLKEKAQSEIEKLRADNVSEKTPSPIVTNKTKPLLDMAADFRKRAQTASTNDSMELTSRARALEDKAHKIALEESGF